MIVFPNAKINLGLRVLRKRPDGYHDIESVFYPVPLCDVLEIVDTGNKPDTFSSGTNAVLSKTFKLESGRSLRFSVSGLPVDGDLSKNLCVKACMLFDKQVGLPFNIAMHLHKVIPTGAGLGGGSSDASFVLTTLNALTRSDLKTATLHEMASELGSDCPFFILNRPVIAHGRGELMQPVSLSLNNYELVIIKPQIHVSTKEAFSKIQPAETGESLEKVVSGEIKSWKTNLRNDFELNLFQSYPELWQIKDLLMAKGAVYASMTGSGSAIYGLFEGSIPKKNLFNDSFYFSCPLNL